MMVTPKKKFVILTFVILVGVSALIGLPVFTKPPETNSDLLKDAIPVSLNGDPKIPLRHYSWISPEEVVVATLRDCELARFNLKTKETASEPILEKALDPLDRRLEWSVSPNGKWMLTGSPSTGTRKLVNILTGESTPVTQPASRASRVCWRHDSSGWSEELLPGTINHFRLDGKNVSFTKVTTGITNATPIGFANDDRLLFHSTTGESKITWLSADAASPVVLRTTTLQLPSGYRPAWTVCSPGGRRIVLMASRRAQYPRISFLRQAPFVRVTLDIYLSLWTCDIEGNGLKKLGELPSKAFSYGRGAEWSPDESRVGFFCNGQLWVKPVE
jgi:hypothetical protein